MFVNVLSSIICTSLKFFQALAKDFWKILVTIPIRRTDPGKGSRVFQDFSYATFRGSTTPLPSRN
jgi:hypothetical protein